MATETLVCDTSFARHTLRWLQASDRYGSWDTAMRDRVESALLAISVVTIAEVRFGQLRDRWGSRRIVESERELARFLPLTIDDPHLREWARLRDTARANGIAIDDNDLWIAATASVRDAVLVTCDRDQVRIARDLPVDVVYLQPPV